MAEISSRILHKSPTLGEATLGAAEMRKDFQTAVDRGEMPLGAPTSWPAFPYKLQPQFFDAARTMPVAEFRATVQAVLKQFQEAVRQGKLDAFFTEDFKPLAYMRPVEGSHRRSIGETGSAAGAGGRGELQDPRPTLGGRRWRGCCTWTGRASRPNARP